MRIERAGRVLPLLALLLIPPTCPVVLPPPAEAPQPVEPAAPLAALERDFHERINRHRVSQRLAPLAYDERIAAIAREHSQAMANGRPFGHEGFEARRGAVQRFLPYRSLAENVAFNNHPVDATVPDAVARLIASPGHRTNIEGNFDVTGVGIARSPGGTFFYTQIFVLRRR